jgi:putative PEP-CTERM system TPR-repeat lipoprotein
MLSIDQRDEDAATMLESLSSTTSLIPEDEFVNNPSLIFVTALSSYLQGNIEQATKELTKYLNAVPGDLRAISMLTNVYMKQGKVREAGYLLERHEAAVVGNLKLAIRLADLYLTNGQKFEAEMLLEKLEIEYPSELDVILRLVSIYNQSGRTSRARSLIEKMTGDEADIRLDIARGLMYLQNGAVDQAYQVAERLAQKFPENFDMLNFKSAVLIKQNKPKEAQPIIVELLAQRPDFFEAQFNLATTHKMLGDTRAALEILKRLHDERPSHKDVKYMLAQSYVETKNFEAAIPLLETVTTKNTGRMSQELLFEIYMQTKEYQNAYRVMKSLNETHLYNPKYLFKLVSVLNSLNRNDDAIKHLGVLYGLAENNSRMLFDVAVWQRRVKDFDAAEKTLQKLQKLLPKNLRVKVESIRLVLEKGEAEQAMLAAKALNNEVKDEPNVLLLLGDIETANKDYQSAHQYYWKALERDPNFNIALMNLYQIAKMGIEVTKFEAVSKQLIEKNPAQLWRVRLLADHSMNTLQLDLAKPLYDGLIVEPGFQDDPFLLNNMALIYMETSLDDALIYVRKAYDLNDANSSIRDTLGWVYYKLQRYDEALELLRSAHAMDSQDATIRYHLANVLLKLDRKTEAKIELKSAIARGQNETWFESAKILLSQI